MNLQTSEFLSFGPLGGQEIFLIFAVLLVFALLTLGLVILIVFLAKKKQPSGQR
jgi:hypothetical protein